MKILLIFPPLWDINLAPMLSLPTLSGMLKEEGHEVEVFDMNSSFMNFALSKEFFNYFQNRTEFYTQELFRLKNKNNTNEEMILMEYMKNIIDTFHSIKNFLKQYLNQDIHDRIADICKEENGKLNEKYDQLRNVVAKIFNLNFNKDNIPQEYLFLNEWEQNYIDKIKISAPDLVCISLYCEEQYKYTKLFSKHLKTTLNKPVTIGGSWITILKDKVDPKLFDNIDLCIYGEGELALKELAKNEALENIPNIIYLDKNKKITVNEEKTSKIINFYKPNYNGLNLSEYFIPETVLPIETSRGCYWSKCEFCTFADCSNYKQKNIDDLIEEITEYSNKYNVHHLFFTDSALHPSYAEEFSRKILENKLKIYFLTFLRLEKQFNKDLLQLMYNAGLRIAMWGLESGSDKILQKYKKGTNSKDNSQILKLSHDIGIFNYCWLISNFPTETMEDIDLTKQFLTDNDNNIDYIRLTKFTFFPNSPISKHPEDFGLGNNYSQFLNKGYQLSKQVEEYEAQIEGLITEKNTNNLKYYPNDISILLLKIAEQKP